MIEAVIFDLDGTLLNTLDDLTASVNHIFGKYGLPLQETSDVRRNMGNGARYLLSHMMPQGTDTPGFDGILAEYGEYYKAHCKELTAPFPGIMDMLRKLKKAGIRMAIVSNKGDEAVKELSSVYFEDLMDSAVGERQGIRRKPEPDSLLAAAAEMGAEKDRILYVGDSEVDYETAKRAGMRCVLVEWGFRDKEDLEALQPDYLISSAEELVGIVTCNS
ncbi:MAG: HAD family hydrolase [Lachnospiraceae bacterium]|nr:HAD family hydrolase [Lachnospiraceae bacterium]